MVFTHFTHTHTHTHTHRPPPYRYIEGTTRHKNRPLKETIFRNLRQLVVHFVFDSSYARDPHTVRRWRDLNSPRRTLSATSTSPSGSVQSVLRHASLWRPGPNPREMVGCVCVGGGGDVYQTLTLLRCHHAKRLLGSENSNLRLARGCFIHHCQSVLLL